MTGNSEAIHLPDKRANRKLTRHVRLLYTNRTRGFSRENASVSMHLAKSRRHDGTKTMALHDLRYAGDVGRSACIHDGSDFLEEARAK